MNDLKIEATKYIPGVSFDSKKNVFDVRGDSYPENTAELYSPVVSWLEKYVEKLENGKDITINMELEYFNSSSSQVLMDIFDILEDEARNGTIVVINWIYDEENEIALEHGECFQEDVEAMTFNLVPKQL